MKKSKRIFPILLILIVLLCSCSKSQAAQWQEQYDLGVRYLSEGNYEEAIIAFTAAIEIDPKRAEAYVGRGDAYVGSGETDDNLSAAQADYEKARNLDEGNVEIYSKLADIYLLRGDLQSAIQILNEGYEITNEQMLLDRAEELSIQVPQPVPGDLGTYVPVTGLNVPLKYTVVSSEGIQPVGELYFTVEVNNGRSSYTSSRSDGLRTILFGTVGIELESWSDGGKYLLSGVGVSSPENWQADLERSCPKEYVKSSWYQSEMENGEFGSYSEIFQERAGFGAPYHHGYSGGEIMHSEIWCLVLAAYDENGIRVGYTVYQIENTPELLAAKETCTVVVDENTWEIVS